MQTQRASHASRTLSCASKLSRDLELLKPDIVIRSMIIQR